MSKKPEMQDDQLSGPFDQGAPLPDFLKKENRAESESASSEKSFYKTRLFYAVLLLNLLIGLIFAYALYRLGEVDVERAEYAQAREERLSQETIDVYLEDVRKRVLPHLIYPESKEDVGGTVIVRLRMPLDGIVRADMLTMQGATLPPDFRQSAMQAFLAAAPFPPPPQAGMLLEVPVTFAPGFGE